MAVQVKQDGITRLVVLPLYPQFSISTSASSLRLFEEAITNDPDLQGLNHIVIASWYWREGYLQAMADLIEQELKQFPDPSDVEVGLAAALPLAQMLYSKVKRALAVMFTMCPASQHTYRQGTSSTTFCLCLYYHESTDHLQHPCPRTKHSPSQILLLNFLTVCNFPFGMKQIFFSAHGVPVSYVLQDGDPYKEEMEQCIGMIMQRLRLRGINNRHTLAYQSRVGPVGRPCMIVMVHVICCHALHWHSSAQLAWNPSCRLPASPMLPEHSVFMLWTI